MASGSETAAILEAVISGDIERVRTLISKNPELANARGDDGETPLHEPAFSGNMAVVELLLAAKADPNLQDKQGKTPLHHAAREGQNDMVALLLAHRANPNAMDEFEGRTPLHAAVENEKKGVVELLLAGRANVNAEDKQGNTPLHLAAAHGLNEIAELLLLNAAHINGKTKTGWTPLSMARGRLEQVLSLGKSKYKEKIDSARKVIDLLGRHGAEGWRKEFSQVVPPKISGKINWDKNKKLLVEGTRLAVTAFLEKHGKGDLRAIGYVFELWNQSSQFDLCADTWPQKSKHSTKQDPEDRWNSGVYKYPAALISSDELEKEWVKEAARLHELANDERYSKVVYDGLIKISCEALAELARAGLFGDISQIDFNVSEVGDKIDLVMERDKAIRRLIGKWK